jgi:hypothetical protein
VTCKQWRTKSRNLNKLILLTDLLTTDLRERGCFWNRSLSTSATSRTAQRSWTPLDTSDLAADQVELTSVVAATTAHDRPCESIVAVDQLLVLGERNSTASGHPILTGAWCPQVGAVLLWETIRVAGLARGLSAGLSRWRAPRAVHDPGKIVADLADVREGYRLKNRPLVGAQRDPHPLQRLRRSRV